MSGQKVYDAHASNAYFLLGGLGAGNVSLGARAQFAHWEIFNRPNKGGTLGDTFFSIFAKTETGAPVTRILEAQIDLPHGGEGTGIAPGLPRLKNATMRSGYPFVRYDFADDTLPVCVSLEAFTPFIPLNPEDSGLPCAVLRYTVKNPTQEKATVTIVGSFMNPVGLCDMDKFKWSNEHDHTQNINEIRQQDGLSGLYMYATQFAPNEFKYGNMCLTTQESEITAKPYWYEGGTFNNLCEFWDDFCDDGLLEPKTPHTNIESDFTKLDTTKRPKHGSFGVPKVIEPGGETTFTFVLSWFFPNRVRAWEYHKATDASTETIRNHYATRFDDAWAVSRYVFDHLARLENLSRTFENALYGGTVPDCVLEAAASSLAAARSQTVMWLETGYMAAWEGCGRTGGSCFGTCTHVWNYAQTMAFLFPSFERSAREIEFCQETDADGKMAFRTNTVFGLPQWEIFGAPDGQLGAIIRFYREWKLSGDHDFLRKSWDGAKRALDYCGKEWDSDNDFVLDGKQHNTYDIEFYGVSALTNALYYAALKAGAEMAAAMGETELSATYTRMYETGSACMDRMLWNGEYYIQQIDDLNKYNGQYGEGCLSDQLFGQMLAHVAGLGYILPEAHVKRAVKAIYDHNFFQDLSGLHNFQRAYAYPGESGLAICTWPRGGRPKFPFLYSAEVWTGIEYQVAAHLIYEGFVDEGLAVVKAARDRYDGYKRNPWSDKESGDHYARSMSAWAVLTALSGFQCDMVNKTIHFSPKMDTDDFSTFWSTGTAWGTFSRKRDAANQDSIHEIKVLYGNLDGVTVYVNDTAIQ